MVISLVLPARPGTTQGALTRCIGNEQHTDGEIVQRVVAQLPWRQNIALLERLSDVKSRLWYAEEALRHGWSLVVEYALRGFTKPIGVADWETQLTEKLPENLKGSLPTVEEIEAELLEAEGGD